MKTQEFFNILWEHVPEGWVNMRLIPEQGGRPINSFGPVERVRYPTERTLKWLHDYNQTHHIYHRVAVSKHKRDAKYGSNRTNATPFYVPALWVDVDDPSLSAREALLDMWPNIVISSGGGWHGYWLLREPVYVDNEDAQHRIERTNDGLALHANGDRACKNINRIMRTPGFANIKSKYQNNPVAEVVSYEPAPHRFEQLYQEYAPSGAPPAAKVRREIPQSAVSSELPGWVRNYLQYGETKGNRNNRLYAVAMEYRAFGKSQSDAERDLLPRAIADGLSESSARATINSAYKSNIIPERKTHTRYVSDRMKWADARLRRKK